MKLVLATNLWVRLRGLLKSSCCANNEVLLLAPCKSIHSFGMRCELDVAFLDAEAKVLLSERNVRPGKVRSHSKAVAVLERRSSPGCYWPAAGELLSLTSNIPATTAASRMPREVCEEEDELLAGTTRCSCRSTNN